MEFTNIIILTIVLQLYLRQLVVQLRGWSKHPYSRHTHTCFQYPRHPISQAQWKISLRATSSQKARLPIRCRYGNIARTYLFHRPQIAWACIVALWSLVFRMKTYKILRVVSSSSQNVFITATNNFIKQSQTIASTKH